MYAAAANLDAFAMAEQNKWTEISSQPSPCFYNYCTSHEKSTAKAIVSELEQVRLSLTPVLGGVAKDEL